MTETIPDVHEHDREIPHGKTLLCEYGDLGDQRRPQQHTIAQKTGWGRRAVRLQAVTAGWACAGAVARWDNGHYSVSWNIDGARHGRRYATLAEAQEHFDRIPELAD
jgi:hypothetical protein